MTNPTGHPASLQASHPGNTAALKSGVFSRSGRVLAPRVEELAGEIMASGFVEGIDWLGARELGSLLALGEALDADIAKRGALTRDGNPRRVVDMRLKLSGRIERWLVQYGATPASRATLAQTLATGGLAAEIARRRAQTGAGEV